MGKSQWNSWIIQLENHPFVHSYVSFPEGKSQQNHHQIASTDPSTLFHDGWGVAQWPSGRSRLLLVGKKSAVQHEDRREEPFAHLAMEEYLWLSHDEIHEIPWKITHEIPKKCQVMIYFDG